MPPLLCRKKPVIVEVYEFDGTEENWNEIHAWVLGHTNNPDLIRFHEAVFDGKPYLVIDTLEGPMTAAIGSIIIRGVANEFYRCDPEIFKQTYEEVDATYAQWL